MMYDKYTYRHDIIFIQPSAVMPKLQISSKTNVEKGRFGVKTC